MRLVSLTVLAAVAMTGSAYAETQAFIGQVGDGHEAYNVQLGQVSGEESTAVIFQSHHPSNANGHDALHVQLGPNNYAYTFQQSYQQDHTAAAWQGGEDNTALNVQLSGGGNGDAKFTAIAIQDGDNNTAVNWQQTGSVPSEYFLTLSGTPPNLLDTLADNNADQFANPALLPDGIEFD